MNSLLDADIDDPYPAHRGADREISLGTATILGIFFALALVCAAFFGFGYTLGRKSAQNAMTQAATAPVTQPIAVKPAAGSSTDQPLPVPAPEPIVTVAEPIPTATPKSSTYPATIAIKSPANNPQPATANLQPAVSPAGTFMVQIAAVSTQEIADIELTALKKYGFDVIIRHEPQDQLLHVQIGPYATRKDAVAMQQNILAHGFNAIVK